jgi:hypothetical protein
LNAEPINLIPLSKAVNNSPVPIVFLSPSEAKEYQPPENARLVGDCHLVRGSISVIGGAPGVGKSRASVALAVAGATALPWFGLPVHRQFKTLIVQNENGRYRLKQEFSDLDCATLDAFVRICPPPAFGFAFERPDFVETLSQAIEQFQPDVVVFDPWNAAARDDKAADYQIAFNAIRSIVPTDDNAPAIVIVAHTRKPKNDEKSSGRGLMHTLAGSYVIGSVPRSVFVLQPASNDTEDDRVVFTCCKNNDGELGGRSCWQRRNGLFVAAEIDWNEFDGKTESKRRTITEEDLRTVFDGGKRTLSLAHAAKQLQEITGACRAAAYNALKISGRFGHLLRETDSFLSWCGASV